MKQLLNYIPVILGVIIVTGAILMTGGFSAGKPRDDGAELFADTQPASSPKVTSPSTSPAAEDKTSPRTIRPVKTFTSATTTTTTSSTTTTTQERVPEGGYSSIRLFVDIQRIVLYRIDSRTGQEYPAVSLICSSGAGYPTPVTGESEFRRLSGGKAAVTRFSFPARYSGSCLVRYAVNLYGPYWFHSVPYLDPTGGGQIILRKDTCDMSGYKALGRRASSGCIRMCLSDAKFFYSVTYKGMPCRVLSSSKGYEIPKLRTALPSAPAGARNWDPTDPEWPGYVAPPVVVEPTPPTDPPTEKPTEKPTDSPTVQPSVSPEVTDPAEPPGGGTEDPETEPTSASIENP